MEHHADHTTQAIAQAAAHLQSARAELAFALAQGDELRADEAYELALDLEGQLSHLRGA